jgi:putative DNA primase/helicase
VAGALGLEFIAASGAVTASCVWHAETRPSMNMRRGPGGTLQVKCFSCGRGGNLFHLVAEVNGLDMPRDFVRVLELAAELVGASPDLAVGGPAARARELRQARQAQAARDTALAEEAAFEAMSAKATEMLKAARPVELHPYLRRKGIRPHGAKVDRFGNLVLGYQDVPGKFWTWQTITPDGDKRFPRGGRVAGNFVMLRSTNPTNAGPIVVCEGWATACSISEATGFMVLAAGMSTNLANVARAARGRCPDRAIVLAADDDRKATGRNPGREAAEAAALEVGGTVVLPGFGPNRPEGGDWNDLAVLAGLGAVRAQFAKALRSPKSAS